MKKEEETNEYFKKAYQTLSKDDWVKENEAEKLLRLKKLAGLEKE